MYFCTHYLMGFFFKNFYLCNLNASHDHLSENSHAFVFTRTFLQISICTVLSGNTEKKIPTRYSLKRRRYIQGNQIQCFSFIKSILLKASYYDMKYYIIFYIKIYFEYLNLPNDSMNFANYRWFQSILIDIQAINNDNDIIYMMINMIFRNISK